MNFTTYGRALFMVGGNADASFLAALPVKRYRLIAYMLSGFSAGLAGVILTARLYAAAPQAATGLEFSVIAAVVLGGTSLAGGKGTLLGTAIGVLILGTLNNGMTMLSLSSDYQQIVQGLVLALAVAIDQFRLGAVDIAVFRKQEKSLTQRRRGAKKSNENSFDLRFFSASLRPCVESCRLSERKLLWQTQVSTGTAPAWASLASGWPRTGPSLRGCASGWSAISRRWSGGSSRWAPRSCRPGWWTPRLPRRLPATCLPPTTWI